MSWAFVNVSAALYCPAALIFLAGFLNCFSFMKTEKTEMFTLKNLKQYYLKRIFRFLPLVALSLVLLFCTVPLLGSGPVWYFYDDLLKPCRNFWWTNLLFINNMIPFEGNYGDKCMPWAWFIPVITQLSLILPIYLYLLLKCV
jgi:peptidoglycan/LPS O-acetylase OafA/YrhL